MNLANKIRHYVYKNRWTIGFTTDSISSILSGCKVNINWVKNPYKNRWFADPFILDYNDEVIEVLVEEFYDSIDRGRISKLTISRINYSILKIDVILELGTHLSFPAIKRVKDEIFFYPENGASNELWIYKYYPDSNRCEKVKLLAKGYLADAIETSLFGIPLLFATVVPNHNGNQLQIFKKLGEEYIKYDDLFFDGNIARNAGDWFIYNGEVFRPAQDCNIRYGGAIIFQKISYSEGNFSYENVRRLEFSYNKYKLGGHTFNHYKNLSVVDVNGYRNPLLANLGLFILKLRYFFRR